jgi:hypothetical protein
MPAKGEPLSKEQQALFRQWIQEGADWPEAGDQWIAGELAAQVLPKITFALPPVDEAQQKAIDAAIAALRQKGMVVQSVAADTNAVEVNLSLLRDKVGDAELAMLRPLAPVLVWLNASRTAVTDAGAKHIGALTELRRLNLANTKLGDKGYSALMPLKQLEYLNAYGTELRACRSCVSSMHGRPRWGRTLCVRRGSSLRGFRSISATMSRSDWRPPSKRSNLGPSAKSQSTTNAR